MRILLQHAHAPGEISGVVTYCEQLQEALIRRGHQVRILSTHGVSLRAMVSAVQEAEVVHLNSHHFRVLAIARALGRPVVLKYHYPYWDSILEGPFAPAGLWHRFWRDVAYVVRSQAGAGSRRARWRQVGLRAGRAVLRVSMAFVVQHRLACSAFIARSADLPLPVEVDYCPSEFPVAPPLPPPATEGGPTFVFVGRLENRKGCDVLLRAAALLRADGRRFRVLVLGEGPERARLEEIAAAENLRDGVTFLGRRSREEVLHTLRAAVAAIVPSSHNEALSYVVIEAAMQGRPAIGTQGGGIPELIGAEGLLFMAGDHRALARHMELLLRQPEFATRLGREAFGRLRSLCSPDEAALRTERVYRGLFDRPV